ncbi:PQQ-binding-like beta-propeller repeat protein [bacterium]|nr:PQQ-binding-like beta-propeller repeat protein [bacterium]
MGQDDVIGFKLPLPDDAEQPWERSALAIDSSSDFTAGRDWFSASSGVTENGEAARLSGIGLQPAHAIWRIPLGGSQPGTLSADVNLLDRGNGSPSSFYLGLANFASGRWDWQGPFTDSHVRLGLGKGIGNGDSFLSSAQNIFAVILVPGDSRVDVLGIGLNAYDAADSEAPPQPAGLTAAAVRGGLELQWNPVIAADLAGYAIYYSDRAFTSPDSAGVRSVIYLEGSTHFLLDGLSSRTYLRISALDHSGNRSPASELVEALPLAGSAPPLVVETDLASGGIDSIANLSASGADSYDIDADGDGIFEISGSSSGSVQIDTGNTGIIRPRVRGVTGEAVALGSVSILIAGNSRPLASATADPQSGKAPLSVSFTGIAEDNEDEETTLVYAWDFDGDGIYDEDTDSLTPTAPDYTVPDIYNAKFRVTDSGGASDVDTVTILVTEADPPANDEPTADLQLDHANVNTGQFVTFDASGSNDPDGTVMLYEWDFNGDGTWDGSGAVAFASHSYPVQGAYQAVVRVTDNAGGTALASRQVIVTHGPWTMRGHDPMHTGRSPYVGPQTNNVAWTYTVGDDIRPSSPALAADGTVFVGSLDSLLYAVNPDGSFKWSFDTAGAVEISPSIGPDGTVYFGSNDDQLRALYPDGSLKWSFPMGTLLRSSPVLDKDGTIYAGSGDTDIFALNPDGSLKWQFETAGSIRVQVSLGPDGTIYIPGYSSFTLYALNNDGSYKWEFPTGAHISSSPAIAEDGTIYVGSYDESLYAINPDGSEKWSFQTLNDVDCSPSIALDGTIYVGSRDDNLYAINPDGTQKWKFLTGDIVVTSPAIGADGTIYIGSFDNHVYAINPDGSELWNYDTGDSVASSPAIGVDGRLYVGSYTGELIAFGPTP